MNNLRRITELMSKQHKKQHNYPRGGAKFHNKLAQKAVVFISMLAMLSFSVWGSGGGSFDSSFNTGGLIKLVQADDEENACANGHTWGEWELTNPDNDNCTKSHTETRTCTVCSNEETRTVAAKGHTWGEWQCDDELGSDPTCTKNGTLERECKDCGATEEKDDPSRPALGRHDWSDSDWVLDPGSTCESGTMMRRCGDCSHVERAPARHVYVQVVDLLGGMGCVVVGGRPAIALMSSSDTYASPDCTSPGLIAWQCIFCGTRKWEPDPNAPALGHDFVEVTLDSGIKVSKCSRCGLEEDGAQVSDSTGCTHELEEQTLPATATSIGVTRQVCKHCNKILSNDYFMLDGTFPTKDPDGNLINDTAPSAVAHVTDGEKTYTIILQDPLRTLVKDDSDKLELQVSLVDEPIDFDGFADGAPDQETTVENVAHADNASGIESMTTFEVVPIVNGIAKSGQLNKNVRMLYKLSNGEDKHEMEQVLVQKGVDTQFQEDLDSIGDDEYLVTWTNHYSTYAFIDRLTDSDKVSENEATFPVVPVVTSSILVVSCVAGAYIYIRKKKKMHS